MSKLTLDLNTLNVESFSATDALPEAQAPTTITVTVPVCCIEARNGTGVFTDVTCDYVAAATHERICTTTSCVMP